MKSKGCFLPITVFLVITAFAGTTLAQSNSDNAHPTGLPKFLNMVHQELKPGRTGTYDETEISLVRGYNRENIPVFWVELESMTGPSEALYLNFFNSSEEMSMAMEAESSGLAAHPDLLQMQDRLLQDNTSSMTTVLGVRRDDMGFRANTIDFSNMRMLRLSTVFAHPGYERAFMEAEWSLSAASEKVNAQGAWAVYQVIAGLPEPTFIIVAPMRSLQDVDDELKTNQALQTAEGGEVEQHLQELARVAYGEIDNRMFSVGPKLSHVSKEFAVGDSDFWAPATTSATPASAAKPAATSNKAAPKKNGAPAPSKP